MVILDFTYSIDVLGFGLSWSLVSQKLQDLCITKRNLQDLSMMTCGISKSYILGFNLKFSNIY